MAAIHPFFGRTYECSQLSDEFNKLTASLIIVYGRRRVGKTRLVTEFYKDKGLWKFDGVEGLPKSAQIKNILE